MLLFFVCLGLGCFVGDIITYLGFYRPSSPGPVPPRQTLSSPLTSSASIIYHTYILSPFLKIKHLSD
jgi:hypothetical protein